MIPLGFELVATTYFKGQFDSLALSDRKKIQQRLSLAKENPYRNKAVHSFRFGRLFRIRLEIGKKERRVIYAVIGSKLVVAGMLDRGKDYEDLEKLLANLDKELPAFSSQRV